MRLLQRLHMVAARRLCHLVITEKAQFVGFHGRLFSGTRRKDVV